MVVGIVNSGIGLGNTLGPIIGGAITDALDYPWMTTILAMAHLFIVSVVIFACFNFCDFSFSFLVGRSIVCSNKKCKPTYSKTNFIYD